MLNELSNWNCQRDRSSWVGEGKTVFEKNRLLCSSARSFLINNYALRGICLQVVCRVLGPAGQKTISLHSYPAKLSAMMSLSSCTFLECSTSTDCINFGESLILAQRSVNRLWNHDILLLTVAKNETVAAGGNLFPNSTLQCSHSEIACICVYFSPQGERRTWPFVKLGHPSSGSGSEGATQA